MSRFLVSLSAAFALGVVPDFTLNNGVKMPAIAAGTWEYDASYAEQSVSAALAAGIMHIDTA